MLNMVMREKSSSREVLALVMCGWKAFMQMRFGSREDGPILSSVHVPF